MRAYDTVDVMNIPKPESMELCVHEGTRFHNKSIDYMKRMYIRTGKPPAFVPTGWFCPVCHLTKIDEPKE